MAISCLLRPLAALRLDCRPQQSVTAHRVRCPSLQLQPKQNLLAAFPAAGSQQQCQPKPSLVITAKYKMKTRKAAAKRFRVTGSGKVKRRSPGKQHINEKKTSDRLRTLGKPQLVHERDLSNVIPNLPYAGIKQR